MSTKPKVACPQCGKKKSWSPDNPYRPFCSERCRTIDLGAWASEEYQIPTDPSENEFSSSFDDPESGMAIDRRNLH